jgi:hypothetical protein
MINGKPNNNYRYLFTKIDKRPQFLVMKTCNLCPYLINDFKNGEALCGKYANTNASYPDKGFISKVHGYIQRKIDSKHMDILSGVDIPYWCGLPDHLTKITKNDSIHTIKDGKVFLESGQNYANTIQIIDSSFVVYDENHESLISRPDNPTYVNYGSNGKRSTSSTTNNTTWKSKYLTMCSSCGEEKEEVDRNIHLGMCDNCCDKNKFSHPKRYNAKINNFRLKRKEDWKNDEFKPIINKKTKKMS